MNESSEVVNKTEGELVITRVFDAPRELVWRAWSEGERLAQWWGPKGCEVKVEQLEFRPGGIFHYCMKLPDEGVMWGKFVYDEIVAPERLSFVDSFADENGNIIRAPFFDGGWPLEVSNLVSFSEQDGQTTMTLRVAPINATEDELKLFADSHGSLHQGYGGTMDQLEEYLAKG